MKFVRLIVVFSLVVVISETATHAQLRYPSSVQKGPTVVPTSFDYYSQGDETASPSDKEVPSVPVVDSESDSNGCASSCEGKPCCDTCSDCKCDWCNLGDAYTLTHQDSCITIGGWWQNGYSSNEQPFSSSKGDGLAFNDSTGNLDLHQAYVHIGKEAESEGSCCWDWGFRFDMLYGTDAQKTQAFGNSGDGWDNDWDHGRHGWAIPQLYFEVAVGDLSVKAGHFYKIAGYEVVPASDNFFFSRSLTMFNAEPITHTGVLSTYKVNDCLTVYGGWTAGWDTGFDQFDADTAGDEDGSNFLGGFSITNCNETATFTYVTNFGDFGWRGANGYAHSMVLDLALCQNLNYVIQSDYVHTEQFNEDTVGITQYLFHTVNDCLSAGFRFEWFKDDFAANADTTDVYAATFGLNVKPHANVMIRPEVRHNWNFEGFDDENITVFGVDSIISF